MTFKPAFMLKTTRKKYLHKTNSKIKLGAVEGENVKYSAFNKLIHK